jgi:hypothetical protein
MGRYAYASDQCRGHADRDAPNVHELERLGRYIRGSDPFKQVTRPPPITTAWACDFMFKRGALNDSCLGWA